MGTRNLGSRPWLAVDDRREAELALKARLLTDRHDEVFAALPDTEAPGQVTLALIVEQLEAMGLAAPDRPEPAVHPLDAAGRHVQEDLCVVRREPQGWILVAASLCFPSRWRLADKMGLPLDAVHRPVEGYQERLAKGVDGLFDKLGSRIVMRRNWFVHPDGALFQPDRPVEEPVIEPERCLFDLHVRSERQTLRRLDDDHALFTIRVQQDRLEALVASSERLRSLRRFLVEASEETATHRGLGRSQRRSLQACLDALPR